MNKNWASIYLCGLCLDDKLHIKKLNIQVLKLGYNFTFKFSKKERDQQYNALTGNIVFNYDVQTELRLIHNKCQRYGLQLVVIYDKNKSDGTAYLSIKKQDKIILKSSKDYIYYVFNDTCQLLLFEMFVDGLAKRMHLHQRDFFSAYYSMNYNEVDRKITAKFFTQETFLLTLRDRENMFLLEGSWFQIIEKNNKEIKLRLVSTEGRRTYLTIWINQSDIKFLTYYISKVIEQNVNKDLVVLSLHLYSEQKRDEGEKLIVPIFQLLELITAIHNANQMVDILLNKE